MAFPQQITAPAGLSLSVAPLAPRDFRIVGADGEPILIIHMDGRVELTRPELADEAAHVFADFLTQILRGPEPRIIPAEEPRADHL